MIKLPWDKQTVPHCVLEITRNCNLSCKACYREKCDETKSVEKIIEELKIIEKHQKVHTVSLTGGEPTLHPQLCEIVRKIKLRNHKISLVTNGLILDDEILPQLKSAGVDVIMIHVDEGQKRPDLPNNPTIIDINNLRKTIADKVVSYGIDAGINVTIYDDSISNIPKLIQLIFETPSINFLFATHVVAISKVIEKSGTKKVFHASLTRNSHILKLMKENFDLDCYAYIPSKDQEEEKASISYFIPVLHNNAKYIYYKIQSCWADKMLLSISRIIAGRYIYYSKQNSIIIIGIQVLINGLAKLNFFNSISFLFKSMLRNKSLRGKRFVFENAPFITSKGKISCCDLCPNSTVRDGKIVPLCFADYIL